MADAALTPVIVQDAETNRVLMLAYANERGAPPDAGDGRGVVLEPLARTSSGTRARRPGNTMAVEEIRDDCDGDALLYRVRPNGPACHTGAESCFAPWLWRVVAERAATRPEGSYVVAAARRRARGRGARKVGEEGVEAALAARRPSRTSGSSRSSPTSGSTATSSSPRAACSRSAVEDELRRRPYRPALTDRRVRPADRYRRRDPRRDRHRARRAPRTARATARAPRPTGAHSGLVVFDQSYVQYLTRFSFLATERPVAYVESADGETAAFVPEFEVARVAPRRPSTASSRTPSTPATSIRCAILARAARRDGRCGHDRRRRRTATRGSSATKARRSPR